MSAAFVLIANIRCSLCLSVMLLVLALVQACSATEMRLKNPPKPVVINASFPTKAHHGWKFIRFGPDGKLYVPVGAPCNVCEEQDPRFASIMRMDRDGKNLEKEEFVQPEMELGPHQASLGMRFYTGDMFPSEYRNQILIAEHGSWNRSDPLGYRIIYRKQQ
jgi:glucose/arabinose dehydrogenase